MALPEAEIIANLREFYSTADEKRRAVLNEWLCNVQNSDEAWTFCWQLIESSSNVGVAPIEPFVQLFVVNCLYQKLTNAKFFDQLLASSLSDLEKLGFILINLCEKYEKIFLLREKFCSSLAVYFLKTVPDIFEDPFKILKEKWQNSFPSLLLEVFGLLVSEFRKLAQPLERRNLVRSILRQNEAFVANCSAQILQLPNVDDGLTEYAIKCIEAWISFDGSNLGDWQAIVVLCLNKIQNSPSVVACLSKFFQTFVENPELNRMEKFIEQLYDYAANLVTFIHQFDKNDEIYEDVARMIISLGSNQTKILLRVITNKLPSAHVIIDFVTELSSTPGFYPIDETISILPVNFWYHLHEDATIVDDKATLDQNLTHVKPIFRRLLTILPLKLKFHPSFMENWTSDDKDKFKYYRSELSDTLTCCYRVLNVEMTDYLLNCLKNVPISDYLQLESILYVYESIGDYITPKNTSAMLFLSDFLPNLCCQIASNDQREIDIVINSSLKIVSKYNHVIAEAGLIGVYLSIVSQFLKNPGHVTEATNALYELCSWKDSAFEWNSVVENTVFAATGCFNTVEFDKRDRLRALSCVGSILSTQKSDLILHYLNQILAPRLDRLKNCCSSISAHSSPNFEKPATQMVEGAADFSDKSELIFEFDVIATLIGALKSKSSDDSSTSTPTPGQPENISPVFLVIAQSIELFRSLYLASRGDSDVAIKLCEALRSSLSSLYADAGPLLPNFCQLLTLIYPPHSCALPVASSLLLIFGDDQSQLHVTVSLFNAFLTTTVTNFSSTINNDTNALGDFLSLCSSLAKKNSKFYDTERGVDSSTTVELACRCLTMGDTFVAKQAAIFLVNFFRSETNSARPNAEKFGFVAIKLCFERIKTELLNSLVNHVADVIYYLFAKYPDLIGQWRSKLPTDNPLVGAMFKEIGNKMKFREFARQINVGCRKNTISL